jgi:hypothetical protein
MILFALRVVRYWPPEYFVFVSVFICQLSYCVTPDFEFLVICILSTITYCYCLGHSTIARQTHA